MKSLLSANPLGQRLTLILAAALAAIPMLVVALPANGASRAHGASKVHGASRVHAGLARAANAGCYTDGSNKGYVRVNDVAIHGAAWQRTGPSDRFCGGYNTLQPGDDAYYICYTFDGSGRSWTFLHNLRTGVAGWTLDSQLRNNGSNTSCGF
jgi:hypothetical protein